MVSGTLALLSDLSILAFEVSRALAPKDLSDCQTSELRKKHSGYKIREKKLQNATSRVKIGSANNSLELDTFEKICLESFAHLDPPFLRF